MEVSSLQWLLQLNERCLVVWFELHDKEEVQEEQTKNKKANEKKILLI